MTAAHASRRPGWVLWYFARPLAAITFRWNRALHIIYGARDGWATWREWRSDRVDAYDAETIRVFRAANADGDHVESEPENVPGPVAQEGSGVGTVRLRAADPAADPVTAGPGILVDEGAEIRRHFAGQAYEAIGLASPWTSAPCNPSALPLSARTTLHVPGPVPPKLAAGPGTQTAAPPFPVGVEAATPGEVVAATALGPPPPAIFPGWVEHYLFAGDLADARRYDEAQFGELAAHAIRVHNAHCAVAA